MIIELSVAIMMEYFSNYLTMFQVSGSPQDSVTREEEVWECFLVEEGMDEAEEDSEEEGEPWLSSLSQHCPMVSRCLRLSPVQLRLNKAFYLFG